MDFIEKEVSDWCPDCNRPALKCICAEMSDLDDYEQEFFDDEFPEEEPKEDDCYD